MDKMIALYKECGEVVTGMQTELLTIKTKISRLVFKAQTL